LQLTKAGRKALSEPAAETLHKLWSKWIDTTLIDKLSRIECVKGQSGKGKRGLTALSSRRDAIADTVGDGRTPSGRCAIGWSLTPWASVQITLWWCRAPLSIWNARAAGLVLEQHEEGRVLIIGEYMQFGLHITRFHAKTASDLRNCRL
jgi:hypothetical protein